MNCRGGPVHRPEYLLQALHRRTKGVRQSHIVSAGPQWLLGFRVALDKCLQGAAIPLLQLSEIGQVELSSNAGLTTSKHNPSVGAMAEQMLLRVLDLSALDLSVSVSRKRTLLPAFFYFPSGLSPTLSSRGVTALHPHGNPEASASQLRDPVRRRAQPQCRSATTSSSHPEAARISRAAVSSVDAGMLQPLPERRCGRRPGRGSRAVRLRPLPDCPANQRPEERVEVDAASPKERRRPGAPIGRTAGRSASWLSVLLLERRRMLAVHVRCVVEENDGGVSSGDANS
jgi:hypothetical protein